ncbi:MAG: zf-HC2 domain-containing protein [Blastocatellia bacterium]
MKCPSFERLIDYLDNRLPDAEAAGVATHLASSCADCAESRDWYQQVRKAAASDDTVAPPPWVLKRAVRIFEAQRDRPKLAARMRQAIASLVFDSFARPALAGVRSTEAANRQLLYRAGDYSIDLQIAPSEHTRADLIGQVLKEGDPTFESVAALDFVIARGGEIVFSAVTDEMGEFKVSGIEQGIYDLRVELSEGSITVPDLPLIES